jgi:outer membrane protein assembly factor BamB
MQAMRRTNMHLEKLTSASLCFLCASAPLRESFSVFVFAICAIGAVHAENWDRFRGPNGAGQSDANAIPSEWQDSNFLWNRTLLGIGHGSPIIWYGRVILISGDPKSGEQIISAFDAASGTPLWDRRLPADAYHLNNLNSYASSTPAVDADRIYVLWLAEGQVKLAAFSHQGDALWHADVGPYQEIHGFGKSPVVVDGVVVVANESEAESAIVGIDAATGNELWRIPRESGITAFATPCLLDPLAKQKLLVAVSNASGFTAFDPATGQVAWQGLVEGFPQRCVSSPIAAGGLVIATNGSGGNGKFLIAARPLAKSEEPQEVYRLTQGVPQCPTPVIAGDLLFLWHDRGIVSCCDVKTGKQFWRERVGGDYHSSPLRIGNRIFCPSMQGEMVVLAADREYKLLARNPLAEPCHATPAVADNRLYVRTEKTLLCIGQPGM